MNTNSSAKTILIAIDESPVSLVAAREAARLFGDCPDVAFVIVNVTPVPNPWALAGSFSTVGPMFPSAAWVPPLPEPDENDEARLTEEVRNAGVPDPNVELRVGDASEQICDAAEEWDADVIVVGAHEKSALRRLFDPSVTDAVVRSGSRPVLVVSEAVAGE